MSGQCWEVSPAVQTAALHGMEPNNQHLNATPVIDKITGLSYFNFPVAIMCRD